MTRAYARLNMAAADLHPGDCVKTARGLRWQHLAEAIVLGAGAAWAAELLLAHMLANWLAY